MHSLPSNLNSCILCKIKSNEKKLVANEKMYRSTSAHVVRDSFFVLFFFLFRSELVVVFVFYCKKT